MNPWSVLIVSDDPDFSRAVAARWQTEKRVPEITLASSDIGCLPGVPDAALVIVGPVCDPKRGAVLSSRCAAAGIPVVCVAGQESQPLLLSDNSRVVFVPRQDGWLRTLLLISVEILRRMDANERALRAEQLASASQSHAHLGRYMLDARPSMNNALTSVLGNADLLLLDSGAVSRDSREQIQEIHTMALRLHEIMQRFSSLASEMRVGEKESQDETRAANGGVPEHSREISSTL